jgi:hypothetical protein
LLVRFVANDRVKRIPGQLIDRQQIFHRPRRTPYRRRRVESG